MPSVPTISASEFDAAFERVFGGASPSVAEGTPAASLVDTPLGPMLAVAGDAGLERLQFVDAGGLSDRLHELRESLGTVVRGRQGILDATGEQMREYVDGTRRTFDIPLTPRGSSFQLKAWEALCEIPYAETRSYTDMARRVGSPAAVRAIGRANGQNPIAIVVPCHRVIRSDGSLCGYGGGRWRKEWLLEHERRWGRRAR